MIFEEEMENTERTNINSTTSWPQTTIKMWEIAKNPKPSKKYITKPQIPQQNPQTIKIWFLNPNYLLWWQEVIEELSIMDNLKQHQWIGTDWFSYFTDTAMESLHTWLQCNISV